MVNKYRDAPSLLSSALLNINRASHAEVWSRSVRLPLNRAHMLSGLEIHEPADPWHSCQELDDPFWPPHKKRASALLIRVTFYWEADRASDYDGWQLTGTTSQKSHHLWCIIAVRTLLKEIFRLCRRLTSTNPVKSCIMIQRCLKGR